MPFLQLLGGAYKSRSLIAAAQRCLNLYPEATPAVQGEPFKVTHYCAPGLTLQAGAPDNGCRGLYTSSKGELYACYGQHLLHYSSEGIWKDLGHFQPSDPSDATPRDNPVSMADNGFVLIVVDGSVDGYFVDISQPVASQTLTRIDRLVNTGWLGADLISYQDTFFLMNSPGTTDWYVSLSNITASNLTAASNVYTATLAPSGTGYTAGDVLTLGVGAAQITVDTVINGLIATFHISNPGTMTSLPPDIPIACIGGTGTGAEFDLTYFQKTDGTYIVTSATSVPAGSNYTANDVLTLTGTGGAQITVNSVDKFGTITGYGLTNGGSLNTQPSNPVPVTGGTGTGATFTLTYQINVGGFDPLDFVGMTAQVTNCLAAISVHRNVWLLGETAYEIWINTGGDGTFAGSFPFQLYPTGFGNWGCAARWSVATIMNELFWVSQDKFGHGLVMRGQGLAAQRISTHAIEFEISQYPVISDAVGYCYQQQGHAFYVLSFPSAHNGRGATWVFDTTTGEWHERCFIDENGIEYRHLVASAAGAYDKVFAGDWRNGNLYIFDLDNYTDNGAPIKRVRSFPHQIDLEANRRVMYHQLIAQIQVGSPSNASPAQTILNCAFVAPDGTLLQDYHNINDFGATFVKIDSNNAIVIDDAVVGQTSGAVLYSVAGSPTAPDYTIRYNVQPTDYNVLAPNTTAVSVIGRANPSNNGYEATIASNGTQYVATLTVMGGASHSVNLGTISSGDYELYLSMQSTAIALAIFRSQDSNWVTADGTWVGSPTSAVQISDNTYTAPGNVLFGGNWV